MYTLCCFSGLLIAAFVCSMLDQANVWCYPDSHLIQGHAVWHVITAVSFYFIYLFYSQFDLESREHVLPLRAQKTTRAAGSTHDGQGDTGNNTLLDSTGSSQRAAFL